MYTKENILSKSDLRSIKSYFNESVLSSNLVFSVKLPGVGNTWTRANCGPQRVNLRRATIFLFLVGCGQQKVIVWPASMLIWSTTKLYFKLIFLIKVLYFDLFHFKSLMISIQLILALKFKKLKRQIVYL